MRDAIMKSMFKIRPKSEELYDYNPESENTWALIAISMPDLNELIEIDNKYVYFIGEWGGSLSSKPFKIDYYKAIELTAYLSYIFDTIIHPRISLDTIPQKDKTELNKYFLLKGYNSLQIEGYLNDFYDVINSFFSDSYDREYPQKSVSWENVLTLDIPKNDKLYRAVLAYKISLLSFEPTSQILNYWRVLEAVTTQKERYDLFQNPFSMKLEPVYVTTFRRRRRFDLMLKYKKYLKEYYSKLLVQFGTTNDICDFFYEQRRCPSAHNRTDMLIESEDLGLSNLLNDALLLKYLSRVAIEQYWKKLI